MQCSYWHKQSERDRVFLQHSLICVWPAAPHFNAIITFPNLTATTGKFFFHFLISLVFILKYIHESNMHLCTIIVSSPPTRLCVRKQKKDRKKQHTSVPATGLFNRPPISQRVFLSLHHYQKFRQCYNLQSGNNLIVIDNTAFFCLEL